MLHVMILVLTLVLSHIEKHNKTVVQAWPFGKVVNAAAGVVGGVTGVADGIANGIKSLFLSLIHAMLILV